MPAPTTGLFLNQTTPAAADGDQNVIFQSDGGTPEQSVSAYPRRALKGDGNVYTLGTTRPDGVTLDIQEDGTMFVIDNSSEDGSSSSSADNGFICVAPSGAKDGSNTIYTLPAPVAHGTTYFLVRNGVKQRQLGSKAEFTVDGAQITTATPLLPADWMEFYYTPEGPNTESDGGDNVTPVTSIPVTFVQSAKATRGSSGALSASYGSNVTAGNLLIAVAGCHDSVSTFGSATMTDSLGNTWTKVVEEHILSSNVVVWATWASSGGADTVTSTLNAGSANDLIILEYSGPIAVNVDTTGTNGIGGANAIVPTITTTDPFELHVMGVYNQTTASTWSVSPADLNLREFTANPDAESLAVFDRLVTSVGTYGGETITANAFCAGITLALAALKS